MKQFTSQIDFSLTKKRLHMMVRSYSPFRAGSKTVVLLPLLAVLILSFCSKKAEYLDQNSEELYFVPELHVDGERSKQLGIPLTLSTHFTSSGKPFTGLQKVYRTENDSLYMEAYFEDGIKTKSVFYMKNGDVNKVIPSRYMNKPITRKIFNNGVLKYQNVSPDKSEDELGHLRVWHKNGQLGFEVSYIGDQVYQGLMTEYDEEGNIIKQERYEDGKPVETIK